MGTLVGSGMIDAASAGQTSNSAARCLCAKAKFVLIEASVLNFASMKTCSCLMAVKTKTNTCLASYSLSNDSLQEVGVLVFLMCALVFNAISPPNNSADTIIYVQFYR